MDDYQLLVRAKNMAYNRLEPLAYSEQKKRTQRQPIPPALARDLERAQRDYQEAVAVIRQHQAAARVALDVELEGKARAWLRRREQLAREHPGAGASGTGRPGSCIVIFTVFAVISVVVGVSFLEFLDTPEARRL